MNGSHEVKEVDMVVLVIYFRLRETIEPCHEIQRVIQISIDDISTKERKKWAEYSDSEQKKCPERYHVDMTLKGCQRLPMNRNRALC